MLDSKPWRTNDKENYTNDLACFDSITTNLVPFFKECTLHNLYEKVISFYSALEVVLGMHRIRF